MTEVTEWGRGLPGPFMKSLNLPRDTPVKLDCAEGTISECGFNGYSGKYHLPANHFVYIVLDYNEKHGTKFVPWVGGNDAPDDWDGGECLFECGQCWVPTGPVSFEQHDLIIGYTRKEPAITTGYVEFVHDDADEYVTIKKMTAAEAMEWASKSGYTASKPCTFNYIGALYDLGLIINETPVERFKRENPGLSDYELLAKALENNK